MKIKSQTLLEDKISEDILWRKKELTNIIFDYKKYSEKKEDYYWRIGVIFIYSHWEGFIKNASLFYLNYISQKGYKISELKNNFNVLFLQYKQQDFKSKKYTTYDKFIKIVENKDQKFYVIPEDVINTTSNLNFETLLEILQQLNIDKKEFELREKYIEQLITYRNKIAHGEQIYNAANIFPLIETKDEILTLLEIYKTIIINQSSNKSYLIDSP
jgi:hypothetical protein